MGKPIKELKDDVLAMVAGGVRNRDKFKEAIPLLVEFQRRVEKYAENLRTMKQLQTALNESVCDYADANSNAFDTIHEVKDEADVSIISIDGVEYAYKRGWDGLKRISGNAKTATFLSCLPEEWVKARLELSVNEINRLDVSDEELKKHDLTWCAKRTWERSKQSE